MELSKMQISKLDGTNWVQWRYRMTALLRGMDGLIDIVNRKVSKPEKPAINSGDATAAAAMAEYKEN